ncbi:MAG: hypothetical protein C4325_02430 [Blastocatellia bacterium]
MKILQIAVKVVFASLYVRDVCCVRVQDGAKSTGDLEVRGILSRRNGTQKSSTGHNAKHRRYREKRTLSDGPQFGLATVF